MVGETIKMRRHEGVASAGPPEPVDAETLHFEERNLLHLSGTGNIVDAQTRPEFLAVGDAVGKRILEVAAQIIVGLHRHDVCAVGEQQQIFGNLQMVRARVVAAGKKPNGL